MTGLGVERLPRAASPSVSADASAPLPPHIQGAERQRSRWAMRLLVVGGLAGAAWLLTGAAAHAADRADGPAGSLLGSVVGGDTTLPVTGLLTAAAQPLEAVPAHKHHVVADILEVPQRVLSRPVETVDEITHGGTGTTVDAAAGSVDTVLREVAGPLRLTGGPTTTKQQIIAVVADPVATPPVAIPDGRPIAEQPAVAPVEATAPAAPMISSHLSRPSRAPIAGAVRAGVVARHLEAVSHRIAHRHRVVRPTTADDATASGDSPGGDGPAPLQLHLGDVSGTSTSGSGTPTEGGSAAFLPAAIASSTMACHRLPIVSDVEVRRIHAEAPTVSPD